MASSKEYLEFVLDQLRHPEDVSFRPMMGEYVVYCRGKVVGGVYDDRFLLKPLPPALRLMEQAGRQIVTDIPYDGAKPMLVADIDDGELTYSMMEAIAAELPEPVRRPRGTKARPQ